MPLRRAAALAVLALLTAAGTTGARADEPTPTTPSPTGSTTWPLGSTDTGILFTDTGNLDSLFASALTPQTTTPGLNNTPTADLGQPLLLAKGLGGRIGGVECLGDATEPVYDSVKTASVSDHSIVCNTKVSRIRMSSFQSGEWIDTLPHYNRRIWKDCFNADRCEDHLEVPFPSLTIGTVRSGTSAEIWRRKHGARYPDMTFTNLSDWTEIGHRGGGRPVTGGGPR